MNNIKSATTAGLLGIFLGAFGAHNWYLGEKTKGIIYVALAGGGILFYIIADFILPATLSWRALTAMGWLILIMNLVAFVVMMGNGIWGFVEGIVILTQGDAGLMRKGFAVANPNMPYQQPMQNGGYNMQNTGSQNGNYNAPYNNTPQNSNMNNWDNEYNNMPQMGNNNQPMNSGMQNEATQRMPKGGKNAR